MTTEKKPHKHAEILRAIADGDVVQFREYRDDTWIDRQDDSNAPDPITHDFYEWRIKPEVKPDVFAVLLYSVEEYHGETFGPKVEWTGSFGMSNLKLMFDGETGKLKSAEVI